MNIYLVYNNMSRIVFKKPTVASHQKIFWIHEWKIYGISKLILRRGLGIERYVFLLIMLFAKTRHTCLTHIQNMILVTYDNNKNYTKISSFCRFSESLGNCNYFELWLIAASLEIIPHIFVFVWNNCNSY